VAGIVNSLGGFAVGFGYRTPSSHRKDAEGAKDILNADAWFS
jgi:hypothetical protein